MNAPSERLPLQIVTTADALPELAGGVLVPTMGALHPGHHELIELARRVRDERGLAGPVIASVFVNPAQFNESKDFEMYPRDLETDARRAADAGCEVVFAPEVEVMYPGGKDGPEWSRPVHLPECVVDKGMEDKHRPGHFPGVYLVCRRLLELCRPSAAVFGKKDWQQLQLVTEMSAYEGLGTEIIGGETVREPDGLALSSRNVHLKPEDREAALGLSRGIREAQRLGQAGASAADAEEAGREVLRRAGGDGCEYFEVRDAATCGDAVKGQPARVLCAAKVGVTRLIDNDAWPEADA